MHAVVHVVGSRGCPALTAAAIAFDVVQRRIVQGRCPAKVYFVSYGDSSNIHGAFAAMRRSVLDSIELQITQAPALRMAREIAGGGWRGLSPSADRSAAATLQRNTDYLREARRRQEIAAAGGDTGGLPVFPQLRACR